MWLHAPYSQLEHQSQRNQWTEKARRPNIDTMARRQTCDFGRHCSEHTGSRPRCQSLRGEIYEPHQLVYFSANRSGIPRFVQCQFSVLSHHFGRTPDGHLRRLARDVICIPKTLDHCTAFQFGLNTRELCFRTPHRLNDIFTFCSCNDMLAMLSRGQ